MSNVLGTTRFMDIIFLMMEPTKQPITPPPANRFYFVGCFLSWGVDRTQDAINNNL